jgi:cytochrome b6-f complex iron-sulfur subunit
VTELSFVGLRFLSPRATDGEFGGEFNLGAYENYPLGSVTPVEVGRFYLVRLQDGGFLAIYRRCTHLGCAVPFDQASGEFVCPCHGSVFTNEGDVLNQPAPRPLDLFQITINEEAEIIVDTSSPIERNQTSPDDIVYI